MRIGIVTLPGNYNYGNRLQLYANIYLYRSLGHEPEFLEYRIRHNPLARPKRLVKSLFLKDVVANPEMLSTPERLKAFARFNTRIPTRVVGGIESSLQDEYDYFSVGSDQVWNPSYMTDCGGTSALHYAFHSLVDHRAERAGLDWFFLRFAKPEQRIALAPSIGMDDLSRTQCRYLAKGIYGFDRLSVRESRGAELLKSKFGLDATVLTDPTIAVPYSHWRDISNSEYTPTTPYVFAYLLSKTEESQSVLDTVTMHGELPVVHLSATQQEDELDVGPAEFIHLVSHAEHVVTDSFHASVFSMLARTPLTIVARSKDSYRMFSRLESLAQMFGLSGHIYGSGLYEPSAAADYEGVDDRIRIERDRFIAYMQRCMER